MLIRRIFNQSLPDVSYGKTKGILLPRNYLKFPLVKVIVSKIAYKSHLKHQKCTFSPPQVAKMSVTNAKISVTKFASKCHKL